MVTKWSIIEKMDPATLFFLPISHMNVWSFYMVWTKKNNNLLKPEFVSLKYYIYIELCLGFAGDYHWAILRLLWAHGESSRRYTSVCATPATQGNTNIHCHFYFPCYDHGCMAEFICFLIVIFNRLLQKFLASDLSMHATSDYTKVMPNKNMTWQFSTKALIALFIIYKTYIMYYFHRFIGQ